MISDESQSKAQFNLQSLGENKTGYRAENIIFSTDDNFKKSPHLFTLLFIPSWYLTGEGPTRRHYSL